MRFLSAILAVLGAAGLRAAEPPVVVVRATYSGASARVVADAIAAPIEQQLNGVAKLQQLHSRSAADGSYTLHVTFAPGTDRAQALAQVRDRVALAQPALPEAARRAGVSIGMSPTRLIALVVLTAGPDRVATAGQLDALRDEFIRVPGVGAVNLFGQSAIVTRVQPDPDRLAQFDLTMADVTTALKKERLSVRGVRQTLEIQPSGWIPEKDGRFVFVPVPEKLGELVLKTFPNGRVVKLDDVARIERGLTEPRERVIYDGKPAACLVVMLHPSAKTGEVAAVLQDRLSKKTAPLPAGQTLNFVFDFARTVEEPPAYFRADLDLPTGVSSEEMANLLERGTMALRAAGIEPVFAATGDVPFLFARVPKAEQRAGLRARLNREWPTANVRVAAAPPFQDGGYDLRFALVDRGNDPAKLRELADALTKKLGLSPKLNDVWLGPAGRVRTFLDADIDRVKAAKLGLPLADIADAIRDAAPDEWPRVLLKNAQGQRVPLGTVVTLRTLIGPAVVERVNQRLALSVTANRAAGVTADAARQVVAAELHAARTALGRADEFTLEWLAGP